MPKSVTIYTRHDCIQCEWTKKLLDRNNVRYNEIDVDIDNDARDALHAKGFTAIPVVIAGDDSWCGFQYD